MRRFALYIAVALFAFGIGLFVVFQFYWKSDEKPINKKVISNTNEIQPKKNIGIDFGISYGASDRRFINESQVKKAQIREKEYISDEKKASLLFEPTLKKWLNGQKIDDLTKPTDEIRKNISESNLDDIDERILLSASEKNYKSSLIDVNGDSKSELAILSNCSPPEYCELWIFKKTKNNFKVILSTYTEVENFSLRKNKTKKYFDIETTYTPVRSKISLGMDVYKFDGEKYYRTDCYDYIYLYKDKDGEFKKLIKPKLVPLHCC